MKALPIEKKYYYYENSVQAPEADIDFIEAVYKEHKLTPPKTLREDFCGSGALSIEWAKRSPKHSSLGLDLDPEPLAYAASKLEKKARKDPSLVNRVQLKQHNVLDSSGLKADAICAFNYSYCTFKSRELLLKYFKAVRGSLDKGGVFFLDSFGGTEAQDAHEESRKYDKFRYYFECYFYNPITHHCKYAIHYKPKGEKKLKDVFVYDWRLWTLPELRELLIEAGFSKVMVYWEEEDGEGKGNGVYSQKSDAENCLCWIAYVVATV